MDGIDLTDPKTETTVIWATGFCRHYSFLSDSLSDQLWDADRSILQNEGGVTDSPGLYVLGYRWLKRKGSNFVDGVGKDAQDLSQQIISDAERDNVRLS